MKRIVHTSFKTLYIQHMKVSDCEACVQCLMTPSLLCRKAGVDITWHYKMSLSIDYFFYIYTWGTNEKKKIKEMSKAGNSQSANLSSLITKEIIKSSFMEHLLNKAKACVGHFCYYSSKVSLLWPHCTSHYLWTDHFSWPFQHPLCFSQSYFTNCAQCLRLSVWLHQLSTN